MITEQQLIGTKERRCRAIFVNRFYWPDESATSQILTDLAEHLAANGAEVIVIASRLSYTSPRLRLAPTGEHRGVQIQRVWTTAFHRQSIAGRMMDFLTFYVLLTWRLLRVARPGDIIIAKTDPPIIQAFAWFASSVKGASLINWCQDLFPEFLHTLNMQKASSPFGRLITTVRNLALKGSMMNVTVALGMKRTLVAQGVDEKNLCVIRNWCDRQIVPVPHQANTLRQQWDLQGRFVIGYSGNLGRAHAAEKVFALIEAMADVNNIGFVFIGSGHGMSWLQQECQKSGHRHVLFKPYQPRASLKHSLSLPDLHLISLGRRLDECLTPSKFFGILAAGRPIAFLGDPNCDLANEIRELSLGISLDIDDEAAWRSQLIRLRDDKPGLAAMAANARKAHETRFEARHALDAWLKLIEPNLLSALSIDVPPRPAAAAKNTESSTAKRLVSETPRLGAGVGRQTVD